VDRVTWPVGKLSQIVGCSTGINRKRCDRKYNLLAFGVGSRTAPICSFCLYALCTAHTATISRFFCLGPSNVVSTSKEDDYHGSKPLTQSKLSEISQWQKCFSELKISNSRISCTLNGVRRSSWKVVWVTKLSHASETNFSWQIFCSCSWRAIDMC